MSRIDEAFRRIAGARQDSRVHAPLDRFAAEKTAPREDGKVASFVTSGPLAIDTRPSAVPATTADRRATVRAATPALPEPDRKPAPIQDDERLLDVRQFLDYAGFVVGAVRRHALLVTGTFCLVLLMTGLALVAMPKTYHVQTKLLAQRNAVMAALSNPGRAVPWDADSPTRAAAETVLRRDNLISMIGQTNLMEEWERTRPPILRVKDGFMRIVLRRRPNAEEKLDRLVGYLENQMAVVAGPSGDGTVTIDLDWPNAQMAFHLVEAAQQTFLEARQREETAAIGESIGILERYSATLHENINHTVTELQRTQASQRPRSAAAPPRAVAPPRTVTAALPPVPAAVLEALAGNVGLDDPEIPRIKTQLAAKRQELATVEEMHQRQLSDLHARLTQLTTIYTPAHPNVQAVQQNIAALSHDAPQVVTLKREVERLATEYQQRVDAVAELEHDQQLRADTAKRLAVDSEGRSARVSQPVQQSVEHPAAPPAAETGVDFSSVQLRLELSQLQNVLERTDGARIELAVSQAAFKYRYTVVKPAQVPRTPIRPNAPLIVAAGFVGGLLFAVVAAVGKDLLSNRIVEQWQVERQLGLPVLGTVATV